MCSGDNEALTRDMIHETSTPKYTVLVVDDEPLVRLSLKNMYDWESLGVFFGYEAAHGKQALELLHGKERIDILILDINMPVMNGLELIERLQLLDDKPEILILSSHNDFPLVRQAFKLGIHDYVLKTEMEPGVILAHLQGMASRLQASKKRHPTHLSTLSPIERKYLRRQFLKDLLSESLDRDASEKAILFDIRLREQCICLAVLSVRSFGIVKQRYHADQLPVFTENVINSISQILAKHPYGEVLSLQDDRYVLFLSFADVPEMCVPKVYDILQEVEQTLLHYLDISIAYAISPFANGFDSIGKLFKDAAQHITVESRIVKCSKRYILDHFPDPELDLQEISEYVGITKNHLSHQFSKETGENLRDDIHKVRVEDAKKRLLTTNLKVYEVCYEVGYKNVESFSRVFKKLIGVSPNKYSRNS